MAKVQKMHRVEVPQHWQVNYKKTKDFFSFFNNILNNNEKMFFFFSSKMAIKLQGMQKKNRVDLSVWLVETHLLFLGLNLTFNVV